MELYASNKLSTMPYSPLYHYRRHDRITDIKRRSRPYAGTEHDIAPAERILRLRFRRHARHEQGSEQDDSPFHTVHLHDSPFLPIPYLPCGKPPQSKYINFIRASLLYGRERKLPDGIRLHSPCIVKDWKCETHSLSLSCYPMGRDILMKVFRFLSCDGNLTVQKNTKKPYRS